jgi:tol-pal system protein YbgF
MVVRSFPQRHARGKAGEGRFKIGEHSRAESMRRAARFLAARPMRLLASSADMARPGPSWLVVAVICGGCAHAGNASPTPSEALDPTVAAVRRDNAMLRRQVDALEDRVVRLEREQRSADSAGAVPSDRELPVVRLEPPSTSGRALAELVDAAPKKSKRVPKVAARSLGQVPNSGVPDDAALDEESMRLVPDAGPLESERRGTDPGKSYRLVGNRLVELTKANAPKRPDRPARDKQGTVQLTEYEAAMALYKAGELAGAERAFELFARSHPKHDYADNALYWKGEAAYDQGEWDDALTAFTEVVERYGGGNKAPDALLKIGLCYGKLGDGANARDVLSQLVAAYPDARASDIARVRLSELES